MHTFKYTPVKQLTTLWLAVLAGHAAISQNVAINNSGTAAHASAMLDVNSTTKGMLTPRMTTVQRNAIANPAQGLLVYDTNLSNFMYYNGSHWTTLGAAAPNAGTPFALTNSIVHNVGNLATDNFVFGRTELPKENEELMGTFFFFDKVKGAFVGGQVASETGSTVWQPSNVGEQSFSFGAGNMAKGQGSVALGAFNKSLHSYSAAFGQSNESSGYASFSSGLGNKATAHYSFSAGFYNRATAQASFALGNQNTANAFSQVSIGSFSKNVAGANPEFWVPTDPLFVVGNGTAENTRKNALMLLKNGNLGIGTDAPASLLHIAGDSYQANGQIRVEETGSANDGGRITYSNKFLNGRYWDLYGYIGESGNPSGTARFNFNYSGIRDVLTLHGLGYVGINNSNPSALLDVYGNAGAANPQFRARVATADYVRMRMANAVHTNSYWDIASITSVNGSASANMNFYYFHNNTGGWNILSLQGNGNATLLGTLTQNSDKRLKKNITAIENPGELLDRITGYHYQWKDAQRDSTLQTGLLAQEVEAVMPELVKEDEKGVKSVNYTGMIPYLLEAIKDLKAEVEALKKKEGK